MQKIKFANGYMVDCEGVVSKKVHYNGVLREAYTFLFPANSDLNLLNSIFTPDNCKQMLIYDDEGTAFLHENFIIRMGMGCGPENNVNPETVTSVGGGVSENTHEPTAQKFLAWVEMAQTTYTEQQLAQQQETIDMLLMNTLQS